MRWLVFLATGAAVALLVRGVHSPSAMAEARTDSMRVELVVPPRVAPGAPVPIAIRVSNSTDRALELHLQGRTTVFDLIVRRGDSVVWRRLEGQAAQAILQLRMLAPGEVLELKDTWDQRDNAGRPVGPGAYRVSGLVPTDGEPIRLGPVSLTIEN